MGPFASQDLDFSINPGDPDIHIFTGINGTGKTTILHAIAAMFDHFEGPELHKECLTNNFYKRLRSFFEIEGGNFDPRSSFGALEGKSHGSVLKFEFYGCARCRNLHLRREAFAELPLDHPERRLDSHLQQLQYAKTINGGLTNPLHFAAFSYSSHRLVESSSIMLGNEHHFNPLKDALSFVKKSDPNVNISNWIVSRHASAAVAESGGDELGANRIRQALDRLLESIGSLTDNEFKFSIQTNPWKVVAENFGKEVEFDVLPEGLRSILSWMGDLLMRLDYIPWVDKTLPVNEQHIILLLDEIEVHLHPRWQYQILRLVREIFPNAQIFLTTHSPFILNSIDGARIYKLKTEKGAASLDGVMISETGNSYSYVLENILETHNIFGFETMEKLKRFNKLDKEIAKSDFSNEKEFRKLISELYDDGEEVMDMISSKLARLKRITGKDYFHGANQEKAAV